jgi:GrpB-like predicted nucleotidyltransferase (UPF0157 family)
MKIEVKPYNPEWPNQFLHIKKELNLILGFLYPKIEHIGSTAVPNLAAKPVIDVLVGIENLADLDKTIEPMIQNQYIYYEIFNSVAPQRRLFVGLKNKEDYLKFRSTYSENDSIPHEEIHQGRLSHVHIWEHGSSDWVRHIAFREYLKEHPEAKNRYEAIKKQLSLKSWRNGMEYNDGKDSFIKAVESKAILWYTNRSGNY